MTPHPHSFIPRYTPLGFGTHHHSLAGCSASGPMRAALRRSARSTLLAVCWTRPSPRTSPRFTTLRVLPSAHPSSPPPLAATDFVSRAHYLAWPTGFLTHTIYPPAPRLPRFPKLVTSSIICLWPAFPYIPPAFLPSFFAFLRFDMQCCRTRLRLSLPSSPFPNLAATSALCLLPSPQVPSTTLPPWLPYPPVLLAAGQSVQHRRWPTSLTTWLV